jgi:hypothetical protein
MLQIPPLWGGTLENVEIDLLRQKVTLQVYVPNSTATPAESRHRIEIDDVSDFRWFSTIPGPWSYAELSEIHVSKFGFDGILLEIMLWSEDAGISIAAKSARLDDKEMTPGD